MASNGICFLTGIKLSIVSSAGMFAQAVSEKRKARIGKRSISEYLKAMVVLRSSGFDTGVNGVADHCIPPEESSYYQHCWHRGEVAARRSQG